MQKKMSQDELAKAIGTICVTVGRYERDEVKPSVEVASKIADALEVSLDYLTGRTTMLLDNKMIKRLQDIQKLSDDNQQQIFMVIDALIRDAKVKKAHAS